MKKNAKAILFGMSLAGLIIGALFGWLGAMAKMFYGPDFGIELSHYFAFVLAPPLGGITGLILARLGTRHAIEVDEKKRLWLAILWSALGSFLITWLPFSYYVVM